MKDTTTTTHTGQGTASFRSLAESKPLTADEARRLRDDFTGQNKRLLDFFNAVERMLREQEKAAGEHVPMVVDEAMQLKTYKRLFKKQDRGCVVCGGHVSQADGYMVKDSVWAEAGLPKNDPEYFVHAHLQCLECALDRPLKADDFTDCELNDNHSVVQCLREQEAANA